MTFKKKEKYPLDWLKCPACGSKNFLYNKKTLTYWCRKCGTQFRANFFTMQVTPVVNRVNIKNKGKE